MWQCKWLNLVDNFGTNASGATWWPNLLMWNNFVIIVERSDDLWRFASGDVYLGYSAVGIVAWPWPQQRSVLESSLLNLQQVSHAHPLLEALAIAIAYLHNTIIYAM